MKRIQYIDALKGFAIVWVVLGHIAEHSFDIKTTEFNHFYASFHMPLFMFLSGIFALNSFRHYNASEGLLFLRKKTLRILIPFAVIGG
jgi:fucose 4-O-acetylase-like acetyltransferase